MMVEAIQWQAAGSSDVLDARLASGAGTSKVHALAEPKAWQPWEAWNLFAGVRLLCGRATPRDEEWIGVGPRDRSAVTCERCLKAIANQ